MGFRLLESKILVHTHDPILYPITGYGEMMGLNLPLRGKAVWNLPEGDLEYADLEITKVEYNIAA